MTAQPVAPSFTAEDTYLTTQHVTLKAPADFTHAERHGSRRTFHVGSVTFVFTRSKGVAGVWSEWTVRGRLGDTANVKADGSLGVQKMTYGTDFGEGRDGGLQRDLTEPLGDLYAAAVAERDRIAERVEGVLRQG